MKFVMSYSGGKDSVMALHKMLANGDTPVGLLVMINSDLDRSWFHGIDRHFLAEISKSLDIPLIECPAAGEEYHIAMENGLKRAKELGAEAAVFGDIDIEGHREWCRGICEKAGLACIHPLWNTGRYENTAQIISLGYKCLIKCVKNSELPQDFLGKVLDSEILAEMQRLGTDVCGENGEYHTVVVDGPIFRFPIKYECREILDFGTVSAINICAV